MPEIEKAGSLKTNWLSLSFPSIAITKYSYEQGDRLTYTPEQGYDLSHDRAFGYKDRIHRGVFRLEPDMVTFPIETLHGCAVIDEGNHDITVVSSRLLPHDNIVTVIDTRFDHGIAVYGKQE